ncbi:C40 family peptidase [Nonomuraea longicatena]|uniref:C40 family peptidase n=1 Tax=Nonomuraea longicatena TaxID=83682 RepID=UPI0031E021A8
MLVTMSMTAGGLALHAPAAGAATAPAETEAAAAEPGTTARSRTATAGKTLSKSTRQRVKAGKAVSVAKAQVGDPYRYGATGPGAFDCSGLVQYAWKKAGVKIPRVTYSQYARIDKKVTWKRLRPGDLMFFRGRGHVGMYVGDGRMVHSPSSGKRVRVDRISEWRRASFVGAVRPGL